MRLPAFMERLGLGAGLSSVELPPDLRAKLRARVEGELASARPRKPLFEPGTPGKAANDYWAAAKLSASPTVLVDPEVVDALIDGAEDVWAVPQEVTRLAESRIAREIADSVMRGASRPEGKSPLPALAQDVPDGTGFRMFGGFPVLGLPRLVSAIALADHAQGRTADACRLLLALLRMEQDLARGTPLVGRMFATAVQVRTARLLRKLVKAGELGEDELAKLVRAFERLLQTRVSIADTYAVEIAWRYAALLETYASERYGVTNGTPGWKRRIGWFVLRLGARGTDACATGQCGITAEKPEDFLANHGGLEGAVDRHEREEALWRDLDGMDSVPLQERMRFIDDGCAAIWDGDRRYGQGHARHLMMGELRGTVLPATFVYLALELDRRSRGAVAPDLNALVPKITRSVPSDPITGRSFEYSDLDGRKVLRSGVVDLQDSVTGGSRVEIVVG